VPPSKRTPAPAPLELNATAASVLGFIEHEPMTGWEVAARMEEVIGDFWNVTRSQIYRELKALAAQGLIASLETGPRDRQPYRITEAGRRAFRRWIAERPGPPSMRIPLVLQVFFGDVLPPEDLERSLAELRAYHEGRLAVYRGFEDRIVPGTWMLESLRLGILFQRMMIGWIDAMQKRPRAAARPRQKKK
jgi:DNA-binding PadR family transcriptional regulator